MSKLLSFIIPCYRSELTIEKVIAEIEETVGQRSEYDCEIICVNDCSPDDVYSVLKRAAAADQKVKVVNFAKNMGKHAAVLAGYSVARGEYIVNLDDDFQCPVNELWKMVDKLIDEDYDFVTANYFQKKQKGWKNFGSSINMMMSRVMLDKPKTLRIENFSVMRRFVMDEILNYKNPYPYLEGLILRVTRRIGVVEMEERARGDGKGSGFTLGRSLALWINGFTAFSVKPLRISSMLGVILAVLGFIWGVFLIIYKLVNPSMQMGFTSIMALLLFIGGVLMLILGLIGEYVGRIYICINQSPQYVIRNTINLTDEDERH